MSSTALQESDWAIRAEIYRALIRNHAMPSVGELAGALGTETTAVEQALRRLDLQHQIVLAPGQVSVWMAHPFSAVPTDYPVDTEDGLYWANCAWDSLGIPAVTGTDSWTTTRCAESGEAIEYGIRGGELVAGDELIHFAVPARHWYDNVAFT